MVIAAGVPPERDSFFKSPEAKSLCFLECLSQNVTMIMTYVAKLQGVVWSMLYINHMVCYTNDTLTSNRTKVSPQVNEVLTPGACQALLAYIYLNIYDTCARTPNEFWGYILKVRTG